MVCVVAAVACGKGDSAETKSATTKTKPVKTQPKGDSPATAARKIFVQRCQMCHGASGKGDGPSAKSIEGPKPRNYTDPAWQASVKDEEIAEIIVKGGSALKKNPAMPAQQDLKDKPEVVKEIVKLIRGFANKQ